MTISNIDAAVLSNKYGHWNQHPKFPFIDWQYEVANNDTCAGYWEWVATQLRESDDRSEE